MHIRKGAKEDLARLEALPHAEHWDHHMALMRKRLGSRESLVAEIDDQVVGMAIWDREFFGRAFIWMLGVHPNYHRHGVASELIRKIMTLVSGEHLYTSTNKSNVAMQSLCKGLGFVESGYLENLDPGDPEIFFYKAP